jgi:hypothetical protein
MDPMMRVVVHRGSASDPDGALTGEEEWVWVWVWVVRWTCVCSYGGRVDRATIDLGLLSPWAAAAWSVTARLTSIAVSDHLCRACPYVYRSYSLAADGLRRPQQGGELARARRVAR